MTSSVINEKLVNVQSVADRAPICATPAIWHYARTAIFISEYLLIDLALVTRTALDMGNIDLISHKVWQW